MRESPIRTVGCRCVACVIRSQAGRTLCLQFAAATQQRTIEYRRQRKSFKTE